MPADEDLLTREELRERVGTNEPTLSLALNALRLQPVTLASDRRQKRYRPEWVAQIRKWLTDTYGAI